MADLSSCFTSPKEEKKKRTLPNSSTTSDVDTDAVLDDSDCGELCANKVSDKAHLRLQARKKLKAKGVRQKTTEKKALANDLKTF